MKDLPPGQVEINEKSCNKVDKSYSLVRPGCRFGRS